jgi:signal transduction histidine kinase
VLEVADDGVGPGDAAHESGLRNLRRRAEERGGAMRLRTGADGGTHLDWRVPVDA